MELHNCMEDAVKKNVERILKGYNSVCNCPKCKLDITAVALNNLPPQYTVTDKGKLFTKVKEMDAQYKVDIYREVTKAIELVSRHPHHEI
ncbi:MAG: late competence development ComFB family protein [Tissierellales bacterium]